MIISASEFVKGYCARSGITEREFYETQVPMPDPTSIWGWAAVSNEPLLIKAHVDLYLSQQPENKTQTSIGGEGGVTFLGAHIEPHQIVKSDECRMEVAPVVPEEMPTYAIAPYSGAEYEAGYRDDWNACRAAMLAAATQEPAPERDNVRSEHADSVRDPFRFVRQAHVEWSDRQFGNVGPVGPLKHLAKEANEAAEAPDDISEFADIIMLVWDATRRAGITDEQLAVAVAEKLELNKRRQWGAVKDGEPCHHLKN